MTCLLMLPGWHGSGREHWQSRWPALYGDTTRFVRVEQDDWVWPKRGDWMMRLDETLLSDPRLIQTPAVLVAHSLGCHLVAAWAAHSQHTARVAGALLVAPPDLDDAARLPSLPPQLQAWRSVLRQRLPFGVLVLASQNDPYSSVARSAQLAADWGADFEDIGDVGHVNAESGHGDWPEGWARLRQAQRRWGI